MKVKRIKAKVVMLPTEEKTNIRINSYINETHSCSPLSYYNMDDGYTAKDYEDRGYKFQHLSFTTDEEIKEGDNFYNPHSGHLHIASNHTDYKAIKENGCKKVVATNDKSLKVIDYDRNNGGKYQETKYKPLPQPSKAFVKKYVEVGGIDEVMIDYYFEEEIHNTNPKYDTCKLKVNSHNEITIHPVKDSWSREEVSNIVKEVFHQVHTGEIVYPDLVDFKLSPQQWVSKNL